MNNNELVKILENNYEEIERALAGKKALDEVMTSTEAAETWGKSMATVKRACQSGRFYPWEARKSQGTWLVTRAGMKRLYGELE
ncbi:helix-turn-helix domain-containing protein [Desulfolucanica intricata]|uniref:helix-turn-helix domain-containing protein n=1 Tax=Desulfolucanica intricata TaxID=1285191 RepID=UPI000836092F|nr:helix-turn-helix domain-containing protein [Desulfolucanica intricata]